jgi:hypothetical protein
MLLFYIPLTSDMHSGDRKQGATMSTEKCRPEGELHAAHVSLASLWAEYASRAATRRAKMARINSIQKSFHNQWKVVWQVVIQPG